MGNPTRFNYHNILLAACDELGISINPLNFRETNRQKGLVQLNEQRTTDRKNNQIITSGFITYSSTKFKGILKGTKKYAGGKLTPEQLSEHTLKTVSELQEILNKPTININ